MPLICHSIDGEPCFRVSGAGGPGSQGRDSGCETVTHAGASRPDGAGATPRSATGPRFPVRFVLAGRVRAVLLYLNSLLINLGSAAVTGIGQARFKRVFTLVSRPTFDNCLDVSR
jgi:hypothetical protein